MTSALYLEHYLDSLQHLPIELQRNFKLMRDLDDRAHGLMKTIDLMADDLLPNISTMDDDTKKEKVNTIQGLFNKAKEYGDDKVQLAIQTYELVDKHIRRLDSDLARFESEIQEKVMSSRAAQQAAADQETNPTTVKKGRKKLKGTEKTATTAGKKKRTGASSEEEAVASGRSAAKKKAQRKGTTTTTATVKEQEENADLDSVGGMAHPSDVLDMPVDPNEPTYCLCHQVSYGEMIGCDNLDCPIEWFHFACVDLKIKPKGKWYCPKCTQDRKKK
ncbi:inhibitor of growth protein 5 [Pararge aegeria]|uniref:Inhibitor of growth protein n=2 Tax=Pararge aegeria TaxID=116150 RepID=A0A8S4R9I5_9NEOP|nr:inhibitor of growth protein 5 [Pararge aegeria]CAH2233456.1 jg7895 [Pararge aegeria aegeria]